MFVKKEEFNEEIKSNNFIEYVEYSGNFYGTNKIQVNEIRNRGKICILEIDILGAKKVFEYGLDCEYMFILPPSMEELRKRLINRKTENLQVIERRL